MLYEAKYPMAERHFSFTKFGLLKTHWETDEEQYKRKSHVPQSLKPMVRRVLWEKLEASCRCGRLDGRVYIDPQMEKTALPLQEATASGGVGVLPKGTRMPIPEGKKIRAFTYWEKVDDIDLSMIGLTEQGQSREFSWRTMWGEQSLGITFSGDQVSGYEGGSEYYDIVPEAFCKEHPDVRYLICCNNVFSGKPFGQCLCKAGFMVRDEEDSGEVFEPKTVGTAFAINGNTTYAVLFALDLETREMVWLNLCLQSEEIVAGMMDLSFLLNPIHTTDVMNVARLVGMMTEPEQRVDAPSEADLVFSDRMDLTLKEGAKQVHSWDTEALQALLNR